MKTVHTRSKATQLLSYAAASVFVLAGCSSDDDPAPVATDITVSGVITAFDGVTPLSGFTVQGIYISSATENPSTLTDSTGNFSLTLDANTGFYLNGSFLGYTTINSEVLNVGVNITDLDIGMPRSPETEAIIDTAFPTEELAIVNHAWLAVDIEDENGDPVGGETITLTSTPIGFAYTNCDGTNSGGNVTIACPDRDGPAYIAYFGEPADASVTAAGQSKTAPLRMEQVTVLEYEIASEPVVEPPPVDEPTGDPAAGELYFNTNCLSCHTASSLVGVTIPLDLSNIRGMSTVADITVEIQADLVAYLNSI